MANIVYIEMYQRDEYDEPQRKIMTLEADRERGKTRRHSDSALKIMKEKKNEERKFIGKKGKYKRRKKAKKKKQKKSAIH